MAGRLGTGGLARRVGAALVVCSVAGGVVARAHAEPPATLHLHGGGAWVASATVGQLTLIDGSTAEVVARVKVAAPGADLRSAQDGDVGFGLDRAHGTIVRVDPSTFAAGPPVEVIDGARGDLTAHPHGDLMYVVDHQRGRVAVADAAAATLHGAVRSLAEPVAASVVDARGRLWTLGAHTGDLTWFDGRDRDSRAQAVADPAGATLAVIDGRAAVVEPAGRRVHTLDGHGGEHDRACLDSDPTDGSVRVGGSARGHRLYVVSGDDGVLRVSNLDSGRCGDVAVAVAAPHSDLGTPQEAQGRVFVPDYTTGTVAVVDLDARRVVRTGQLVPAGTAFELFAEDGIVFYNDPGSERAGVVAIDGSFTAVAKYDPDRPGSGLSPQGGDGPAVPDAATTVGGDEGAAGASDPGRGGALAPGADAPAGPGPRPEPVPPGHPPPPGDPGGPAPGPPPGASPAPGPAGHARPSGPGVPSPGQLVAITVPTAAVVAGDDLPLTAVATHAGARVRDARWGFGDGATGTGVAVTHAWDAPGTYRVDLDATVTPGGEATTAADIVVVAPTSDPLVAGLGASAAEVEVGDPVSFTDQSSGGPTGWSWTFPGADGAGTSLSPTPPVQRWSAAGTYTVELVVQRGSDTARAARDIVVDPAPLTVSAITATGGPPFDDQHDYTFQADVTGQIISCTWTIDGVTTACAQAGGRVSATHRFTSGGTKSVALAVDGPGGPAGQATTVDVAHLTAPVPAITVSGAARQRDGTFGAIEGTRVAFTSATTGAFDRLDWTDGGASATGPTWSPTLAPGRYTVTLTARSALFGDRTASVTVVIDPADLTPPVADQPQTVGVPSKIDIRAAGSDPQSGVARIDIFGTISGACKIGSTTIPFDIRGDTTPLGSGTPADFKTQADGSVIFEILVPTGCPDQVDSVTINLRVWSVVTNGQGQTTRSPDYTAS